MLACEVLLARSELPRNLDRTFPLEVGDYIRHGVLRRNADVYACIIADEAPFDNIHLLVRGQFVTHFANMML